jgi:hypothetical protein
VKRLLREPTLHFFILGGLLFLLHHLVVGNPRTIVVSPGVRAAVTRRFQDHTGRAPTAAEADAALRDWKRDEALFREALREGLDRDDAAIRSVLVDKMRARAVLEAPKHEPSDAELEGWLAAHHELYDLPARYVLEWVAFGGPQPAAARERERVERALAAGTALKELGRPIFGATLDADELRERFPAPLAERIGGLPVGAWQRAEGADGLLLLRVTGIEGGRAKLSDVRPRVLADYTFAAREQAIARASQAVVERYQFEERR